MIDSTRSTTTTLRSATPFHKLGIPAYIALAVIIILVTGVLIYSVSRCYQSARFDALQEDRKAAPTHANLWTEFTGHSALRKKSLKKYNTPNIAWTMATPPPLYASPTLSPPPPAYFIHENVIPSHSTFAFSRSWFSLSSWTRIDVNDVSYRHDVRVQPANRRWSQDPKLWPIAR